MKPLQLSDDFRTQVRLYPRATRRKIGLALRQLEIKFGNPHRHQGLGIRKLSRNYFEILAGLDIRLVFRSEQDALLFVMAGNHDDVQRFLRAR